MITKMSGPRLHGGQSRKERAPIGALVMFRPSGPCRTINSSYSFRIYPYAAPYLPKAKRAKFARAATPEEEIPEDMANYYHEKLQDLGS